MLLSSITYAHYSPLDLSLYYRLRCIAPSCPSLSQEAQDVLKDIVG
jgi:hypothetical protein